MPGTAAHKLPVALAIRDKRPQEPSLILLAGRYQAPGLRARSFLFSFVAHLLAVVLVVISSHVLAQHRKQLYWQFHNVVTDIVPVSPYVLPPARITVGGGGGGGEADKLTSWWLPRAHCPSFRASRLLHQR
jgi:hypothetical protein